MIPIRNKKKSLMVTVDEMRNFAFAYIEKYAPSKQQLKTYLLKKYLKISVPNVKKQDVTNLIDIVLSDLEKNKFLELQDNYKKGKSTIGATLAEIHPMTYRFNKTYLANQSYFLLYANQEEESIFKILDKK